MGMTSSPHGPCVGLHTCYNGTYNGTQRGDLANP